MGQTQVPSRSQAARAGHACSKAAPQAFGTQRAGPAARAQQRGVTGRRPQPDHPGGAARSGSQPQSRPASPSPQRLPRLCTFLVARLGCPEAPFSLPAWASSDSPEATFLPVRCPTPSAEKARRRKTREKGTPPGLGLATSRSPPEVPSAAATLRPAGRGQNERRGRGGRSWRSARRSPGAPGSCSYRGEGPQHRASDYSQLSPCLLCAAPALLSALALGSQTSAPRPPRPTPRPAPEAPPPARPEVAGAVAKPLQQSLGSRPHVERLQAPPRAQPRVPRRGAASQRREKAELAATPGSWGGRRAAKMDAMLGPQPSRLFPAKRRRRREGTLSAPPSSCLMGPSDTRPLLPCISTSRAQSGWPGAAVWPELRFSNSERLREATGRGGRSQRSNLAIPYSLQSCPTPTCPSTTPGRRSFAGLLDGGGPAEGSQAFPANCLSGLQVSTVSVRCGLAPVTSRKLFLPLCSRW